MSVCVYIVFSMLIIVDSVAESYKAMIKITVWLSTKITSGFSE